VAFVAGSPTDPVCALSTAASRSAPPIPFLLPRKASMGVITAVHFANTESHAGVSEVSSYVDSATVDGCTQERF
jgi:hypothetical protein